MLQCLILANFVFKSDVDLKVMQETSDVLCSLLNVDLVSNNVFTLGSFAYAVGQGVSNSSSAVDHIYIPGIYTGQTLLKKHLSRQDCISTVPKLFYLPAQETS